MNSLFYKISVFLLIAACAILCIDRTRQNLYMDKIACRIAVQKKDLTQKCAETMEKVEKLQNIIREREQKFHFVMYSDVLSDASEGNHTVFGFSMLKQKGDLQTTNDLAFSSETNSPQGVVQRAKNIFQKENPAAEDFFIDQESGVVFSRKATILSHAAKTKGMDAKTTLFWDLQTYTAGATVQISEMPHTKHKKELPSAVLDVTDNKLLPMPQPQKNICQKGMESVIFPFCISGSLSGEKVILPANAKFPVGGLYLHYFHAWNTGSWFLEYIFPAGAECQKINLQVIPLLPDMTVTSQITGSVQSFLINPGHTGASSLLIVGDKAFFPAMVTASPAIPKLKKKETGTNLKIEKEQ